MCWFQVNPQWPRYSEVGSVSVKVKSILQIAYKHGTTVIFHVHFKRLAKKIIRWSLLLLRGWFINPFTIEHEWWTLGWNEYFPTCITCKCVSMLVYLQMCFYLRFNAIWHRFIAHGTHIILQPITTKPITALRSESVSPAAFETRLSYEGNPKRNYNVVPLPALSFG